MRSGGGPGFGRGFGRPSPYDRPSGEGFGRPRGGGMPQGPWDMGKGGGSMRGGGFGRIWQASWRGNASGTLGHGKGWRIYEGRRLRKEYGIWTLRIRKRWWIWWRSRRWFWRRTRIR